MCDWGTTIPVEVVVPADLSYTGEARRDAKYIDACIAPIVDALTKGGVLTTQSCCGHHKAPGRIDLADGRVLIVCRDDREAETAAHACLMPLPPAAKPTTRAKGT